MLQVCVGRVGSTSKWKKIGSFKLKYLIPFVGKGAALDDFLDKLYFACVY
jgi:hypothetical protein